MSPAPPCPPIAAPLIDWFLKHRRTLPWRTSPRDPYAVWLSEVMLQQTRVSTVVPYFQRFLERFPDVHHLAQADLNDVLSLWSGLGYYSRARALHAAARQVVTEHGGAFPPSLQKLRQLPGVGDYTAAAVASLAFGLHTAVVDGNVRRVLSRVDGYPQPIDTPAGQKHIQQLAQGCLDPERPGEFNEAMMELGATVCLPKAPLCTSCPLFALCEARKKGLQEQLPRTSPKASVTEQALSAVVVFSGEALLLLRRKARGLFGGLWEPLVLEGALSPALLEPMLGPVQPEHRGEVRHVLTHRVFRVQVYRAQLPGQEAVQLDALPSDYDQARWLSPEQLHEVGIATFAQKILKVAKEAEVAGVGKPKGARARSAKAKPRKP